MVCTRVSGGRETPLLPFRTSQGRQRAYYPVGGNFHYRPGPECVMRPWVSALACIFKDRRRRTGRRKNRGALRYHDPIALRVASRVTES